MIIMAFGVEVLNNLASGPSGMVDLGPLGYRILGFDPDPRATKSEVLLTSSQGPVPSYSFFGWA